MIPLLDAAEISNVLSYLLFIINTALQPDRSSEPAPTLRLAHQIILIDTYIERQFIAIQC